MCVLSDIDLKTHFSSTHIQFLVVLSVLGWCRKWHSPFSHVGYTLQWTRVLIVPVHMLWVLALNLTTDLLLLLQNEECWKRCIMCSYCKTEVSLSEFAEHEHACGSRTDQCYNCHKYIMLKDMERHLWDEHREGSGPVVPHNSPTHERKGGGSGSTKESPIAKAKTLFGRLAGAAPASRKMGVSQPARKKDKARKPQAETDVNSLIQQFVSSGSMCLHL